MGGSSNGKQRIEKEERLRTSAAGEREKSWSEGKGRVGTEGTARF